MASQSDISFSPDVANLFKESEKTTCGLAEKADLPAFRVGGQWRFCRTANDSWIEVRAQTAGAQFPSNGPKFFCSRREN